MACIGQADECFRVQRFCVQLFGMPDRYDVIAHAMHEEQGRMLLLEDDLIVELRAGKEPGWIDDEKGKRFDRNSPESGKPRLHNYASARPGISQVRGYDRAERFTQMHNMAWWHVLLFDQVVVGCLPVIQYPLQ